MSNIMNTENLPYKQMKESTQTLSNCCLAYTLLHTKQKNHVWSIEEQALHVHSEVSEVYTAIRKGESINRILHETLDVIYSAFTLLNIIRLNRFDISLDGEDEFNMLRNKNISEVVDKITHRLKVNEGR